MTNTQPIPSPSHAAAHPDTPPLVPPAPPGRSRNRGTVIATAVAAALIVLITVPVTVWVLRDGAELANRPRVTDKEAGLSYAIPVGWAEYDKDHLIDAFTSSISATQKPDHTEAKLVVLAGRTGPIAQPDLKKEAENAAASNAVFFYPDARSETSASRATTVSDRPAHTVVRKITSEDGSISHLRMTVISVDGKRSAFLIGICQPGSPQGRQLVDAVLESARVV